MTIHSCSYYCQRPECIKAQRDELRDRLGSMTDREIMQRALEALEANSLLVNGDDENGGLVWCMDGYYSSCFDIDPINKQTNEAIDALRERLAQPEQNNSRQLDWAKAQADHWKQHCFHLMKQLQEKNT